MRRLERIAGIAVLTFAALIFGRVGFAFQHSQQGQMPVSSPDSSGKTSMHSPFDMNPYAHEMEEKRGRAMNSDRQRVMAKDAGQLVQNAAELEAQITKDLQGAGREDEAKRAEAIEKLARNVKERMKGMQ